MMFGSLLCAVLCYQAYAGPPQGFTTEHVLNVDEVMSMKFLTPTLGLLLKRSGTVLIADFSVKPPIVENYLTLPFVDDSGERGCMSLALDNNFDNEPFIYILYGSYNGGGFRLSRFEHKTNNGGITQRADVHTEVVIWTDPDGFIGPFHYGGDAVFGPDGHIYITTGDKYYSTLAQNMNYVAGKVVRVAKDGTFPSDNMGFDDGPGGIHDGIWATGLRNGFRAYWDLKTQRYFIAEVGGNDQSVAEEDLHLGKARVNFGWPKCEGACNNPDYAHSCNCEDYDDPIYHYTHKDSSAGTGSNAALIGGYVNWGTMFPQSYQGAYFFGDYSRNWIKYLKFDNNGYGEKVVSEHMFDQFVYALTGFQPGLDGSLWYMTLGSIYRVTYQSDNQFPVILGASASPNFGPAPLKVQFSVSAQDPEGAPLSISWNFGNGKVAFGSSVSTTYTQDGTYEPYVSVSDGTNQLLYDLNVEVGTPPKVEITSPASDSTFVANQKLSFVCKGTDGATGATLPDSAHVWSMLLVHDDHTHPSMSARTGKVMDFTVPEEGHGFTSYVGYKATCEVTHNGLTTSQDIFTWPQEVFIGIETKPLASLRSYVTVDGLLSSASMDSMIGFKHLLQARPLVCHASVQYKFSQWEHGPTQASITITVPSSADTFVAVYTAFGECASALPVESGLVMHLDSNEVEINSQGAVQQWKDLASNHHLAPTGSLTAPKHAANGLNGHSVVNFDGDKDGLGKDTFTGLPTGNSPRTAFVVAKYDSPGWGGFLYGSNGCGNSWGLSVSSGGSLFVDDYCSVTSSAPGQGEDWMIHWSTFDGTTMKHFRGEDQFEELTKSYSTTSEKIRLGTDLSNSAIKASYAKVLLYNRVLSEAEVTQVLDFLKNRYFDEGNEVTEVKLIFTSSPVGIPISIEEAAGISGPLEVTTSPGAPVSVSVPVNYCIGNTLYMFENWPTTSSASFEYVAPGADTTVTAVFTPLGPCEVASSTTPSTTTTAAPVDSDLPVSSGLVMRQYGMQGLVQDVNGQVSEWKDVSGAGNNLKPVFGKGAPKVVANALNGKTIVKFDGSDDVLGSDGMNMIPTGNADRSAFMVVKYDSPGWGGLSFGKTGCNSMWGLTVTSAIGELFIDDYCSASGYASGVKGTGENWMIHSLVMSNGVTKHYKNSELIETLDNLDWKTTDLKIRLGAEHNDNFFVEMSVADVIVFDRAVSSAEHSSILSYLDNRYFGTAPPQTATVSISSTPILVAIEINDQDLTLPWVETYGTGTLLSVSVPSVKCDSDVKYIFESWSDGGNEPERDIIIGESDVALQAVFKASGSCNLNNDMPVSAGLVLYLDADQVTDVNGKNRIASWPDSSVYQSDFTVVNGFKKPRLRENKLNGHAFVLFDGKNDALGRDDIGMLSSGDKDRTIIMVVEYDGSGWGGFTWGSPACMQSFGAGVSSGEGNLMIESFCTNDQVQSGVSGKGAGWLIQSIVVKNNQVQHYKDGVLIESKTVVYNTAADGKVRVGVEINDMAVINMDVASVASWNRALGDTERAQVEAFFKAKYDL